MIYYLACVGGAGQSDSLCDPQQRGKVESRDTNFGISLSLEPEMEQKKHQQKRGLQNDSVMAEDRSSPPTLSTLDYKIN